MSDEHIEHILDHSGSVVAFVDGAAQLERVLRLRTPAVRHVIAFDRAPSLAELRERGREALARDAELVARSPALLQPDDAATLV